MAFGQQSGPPASAKQVSEIESLLERAGFSSLREARHIYGLTQRQAGGRFTRTEADELIARLLAGEGELDSDAAADAVDAIVIAEQRAAKRGAPVPAAGRSLPRGRPRSCVPQPTHTPVPRWPLTSAIWCRCLHRPMRCKMRCAARSRWPKTPS